MFDVGAIVGKIIFEDHFSQPARAASGAADRFGGAAKSAAQSADMLGNAMNALVRAAPLVGLAAGITKISSLGAKMEQTQVAFQTMLGGSKKATDAMISSLNEFANVTPFTNDQVTKAARTLMSFGVHADDVTGTLKILGDVSAGTGKDLSEMAVIFGQIRSTGKLMGQDLLQLINAGFNPLQVISEKTGRSVGALKKDMEKGLISFDMVEKAFKDATTEGGLFFNLMEKQGQTTSGLLSTLEGVVGDLGAKIGLTLNEFIKPALSFLVEIAQDILKAWDDLDPGTQSAIVAFTVVTATVIALTLAVSGLSAAGVTATAVFGTLLSPFVLIAAAVGALAAGAVILYKRLKAFGLIDVIVNSISVAFASMRSAMAPVMNALSGLGSIDWESIKQGAGEFVTWAAKSFAKLVVAIAFAMENVPQVIHDLMKRTTQVFEQGTLLMKAVWYEFLGSITINQARREALLDAARSTQVSALEGMKEIFFAGRNELAKLEKEMAARMKRIDEMVMIGGAEDDKGGPGRKPPPREEPGGKDPLAALRKQLEALGSGTDIRAAGEKIGRALATSIWDQASKEGLQKSIAFTQAMGQIADKIGQTFQQVIADSFQQSSNALNRTIGQFGLVADVWLQQWNAMMDGELDALIRNEDAKIRVIHEASAQRRAIYDEEFARRKAQLEAELAAQIAAIEAERISRGEFVQENAESQRIAIVDTAIVDEDARRNKELAEREHQEKLREAERQTQDSLRMEAERTQEAVRIAEENKAKATEDFNKRKEEEENRHAKVRGAIEYALALRGFHLGQQQARAGVQMQLGESLIASALAGIKMAAFAPPLTVPIGIALGSSLAVLSGIAAASAMSAIASTPPPMPGAALFAREGGVLAGMSHQNGGVMVEAQRGEAFLSTGLTERLDKMTQQPSVVLNFGQGAIVVYGDADDRAVEVIAQKIGAFMQQRRF